MITLGLSGLFTSESDDYNPTLFYEHSHDAAACIVRDGKTIVAIEEERLNRDKHSLRFPTGAVKKCLEQSRLHPRDVDNIAFYFEEKYIEQGLLRLYAQDPMRKYEPVRQTLISLLKESVGFEFETDQFKFLTHHKAHAASAYYDSGMPESLILVSDGNAERDGITIYHAQKDEITPLANYSREHSLGHFYTAVTKILGYRQFDEYKVMGLASFGDPERFRYLFDSHLKLLPNGQYSLPHEAVFTDLIARGFKPRRAEEPITQNHKDLAAAAQMVIEVCTLHIIEYWVTEASSENLCIAGGVAQNTSLNGRLLKSGRFKNMFIPAAAHDAGAALGAAILVQQQNVPRTSYKSRFTTSAYIGLHIGSDSQITKSLSKWSQFVEISEPAVSITDEVARHIFDGAVVGWVQGRSEFGPRALGNRSILADPRPAANRDRVNKLIKKREDYRPFAPVVTDDDAWRFFDSTGTGADHSYMGFVVDVLHPASTQLGATTHVDGTSRVQTVRTDQNPLFYELLKSFERLSDIPVLLNTSFNNSAEPIVDSIDDAVATLLTANLSLLAVGNFVVTPRAHLQQTLGSYPLRLLPFVEAKTSLSRNGVTRTIGRTASPSRQISISDLMLQALIDGCALSSYGFDRNTECKLLEEALGLWDARLVHPHL